MTSCHNSSITCSLDSGGREWLWVGSSAEVSTTAYKPWRTPVDAFHPLHAVSADGVDECGPGWTNDLSLTGEAGAGINSADRRVMGSATQFVEPALSPRCNRTTRRRLWWSERQTATAKRCHIHAERGRRCDRSVALRPRCGRRADGAIRWPAMSAAVSAHFRSRRVPVPPAGCCLNLLSVVSI